MQHTTPSGAPAAVPRRSLDRVIVDARRDHPGCVLEINIEAPLGTLPTVRMFAGTLDDPAVWLVVNEWAATIDQVVPKGPRREVRS